MRSNDGRNWSKITWIQGYGSSNTSNYYTFLDEDPLNGKNYYQLKQIDFDGTYEMSKTIAVNWKETNGMLLYPNPASDFVRITFDQPNLIPDVVQLMDATGRLLQQLPWNDGQLTLNNIQAGVYFIQVTSNDKVFTQRLIIQ